MGGAASLRQPNRPTQGAGRRGGGWLPRRADRGLGALMVGALRHRPFVQRAEPRNPQWHPDSLVVVRRLRHHRHAASCLLEKPPFMNARKLSVIGLAAVVVLFFYESFVHVFTNLFCKAATPYSRSCQTGFKSAGNGGRLPNSILLSFAL